MAFEGLEYHNGHRRLVVGDGKSKRWVDAQSKGGRRKFKIDRKMFLYIDLLKLCMKRN